MKTSKLETRRLIPRLLPEQIKLSVIVKFEPAVLAASGRKKLAKFECSLSSRGVFANAPTLAIFIPHSAWKLLKFK